MSQGTSHAGLAGTECVVLFPNGARLCCRYRVVELAAIQPSHIIRSPQRADRNTNHRGVGNAREYGGRRGLQARKLLWHRTQVEVFEPAHLLDLTTFVATGPPIVRDLSVVAGNHRIMILQVVTARRGDNGTLAKYRAALIRALDEGKFPGITSAAASELDNPCLVRDITGAAPGREVLDALNRASDWPVSVMLESVALAGSAAQSIRANSKTAAGLERMVASACSLQSFLNSREATALAENMAADGVLAPESLAMIIHTKTGRLSASGRVVLQQVLLAHALGDHRLLDKVSTPYLSKLRTSIPTLLAHPEAPHWIYLRALLRDALLIYWQSGQAPDTVPDRAESPELLLADVDIERTDLFAQWLQNAAPNEIQARFRKWHSHALSAPPEQGPPVREPAYVHATASLFSGDSVSSVSDATGVTPAIPWAALFDKLFGVRPPATAPHLESALRPWLTTLGQLNAGEVIHERDQLISQHRIDAAVTLLARSPSHKGGRPRMPDTGRIAALVLFARYNVAPHREHRYWSLLPPAWDCGSWVAYRNRLVDWRGTRPTEGQPVAPTKVRSPHPNWQRVREMLQLPR